MKAERSQPTLWTILFLIAVCLLALPAAAQYSGGSGTADDPYQIATAADLIALGGTPGDYDKHFILTADIDLTTYCSDNAAPAWRPVGTYDLAFTGVFDGASRTISNLQSV